MDFVNAFFPLLLMVPLYILPFWLLWRTVRAIEKIADRMEGIAGNENTREWGQIDLFNHSLSRLDAGDNCLQPTHHYEPHNC